MEYLKDENGNTVYETDLLGNRIPVPIVQSGPVKYVGFDRSNLPDNPSPAMLSLISISEKSAQRIFGAADKILKAGLESKAVTL